MVGLVAGASSLEPKSHHGRDQIIFGERRSFFTAGSARTVAWNSQELEIALALRTTEGPTCTVPTPVDALAWKTNEGHGYLSSHVEFIPSE